MTLAQLKASLQEAFKSYNSIFGSYLDALDVTSRAWLEVLWQDNGRGTESILGYAERIRKS